MTTIAFQGEHGAYSEEAIRQAAGEEVKTLPCRAFEYTFDAVESGQADLAVVPIENSVAGSINKSYDLLLDHDLKVHGEILLRVRHNLLTLAGNAGSIVQVRSHPQALAQCEGFLNRHNYQAISWYDTAGSAKELAENPEPGIGVIASKLAAEYYGLEIVHEGIEDLSFNYTRFFLVGKGEPARLDPAKTSLVFAVPNTPGSLYGCLSEFAQRGINLVKLESRPRRMGRSIEQTGKVRPWQYVFYLDFEGHWQDPNCSEALVGILNRAAFVKLLGSYPAAPPPKLENATAQTAVFQI